MQFFRKRKFNIWAAIIVALLFCPSFLSAAETVIESAQAKLIMDFNAGLNIADGDSLRLVYTGNATDPSALLRDSSGNPSYWGGSFWSNYSVIFVNPNGITIGANANIQAASFIASTLNVTDDNFLHPEKYNNSYIFNKWVDKTGKSVINNGYIKVREGGRIVLLGSAAANAGAIEATLGSVALAAGEKITLGLDSAGMISVVIDQAVQEEIFTADGKKLTSAVENKGKILADGGKVVLAAKVLNKVFDYAVNNSGIIQANSVLNRNGVIELVASGAPIINNGTLNAAEIKITDQGTDFINKSTINAMSLSGNHIPFISIQADNVQQEGLINTTGVVIIEANKVLSSLPVDGKVNPAVIIRANEVKVFARQFGSIEAPLNIDAPLTYISRTQGNIDILESLGIGSSILLRGPPDGFGAIVYNHRDTNLTLQADRVNLVGSASTYLYGNITFSNFTCTVPNKEIYFEAGKTYTFKGNTYIYGQPGYDGLIKLFSSEEGAAWNSYFYGTQSISYVAIRDAYNLGQTVKVLPSTNWGNSYNWDTDPVWDDDSGDGLWSNALNWDTDTIPTANDTVTFNNTSWDNSTVDTGFTGTIAVLNVSDGYGGTITLERSLTVTGAITIDDGILDTNTNQSLTAASINIGTNGVLWANSSTIILTSSSGTLFTSTGFFSEDTSTVTVNAGASVTLQSGIPFFYNLTIASASIVDSGGSFIVSNNLKLTSGTFSVGANTLTLNGSAIADTPTNLATTSSSNLVFGGNSTGISIPSSVTALNNLTINNTNGLTLNSSLTLNSPLTLTNGAKLKLTVSAVTDSKTYDGTTSSTGVPTITSGNLLVGNTATWAQTFDTKNVDTGKTLTPAGTVSDGNSGLNYNVTFVKDTTGVITPKELVVTGITAENKVYDGTTIAALNTGTAALSGVVAGDTVNLNTSSAASGVFNNKNVGTGKTVTVSGLTVSGTDAANYSLTQPTTTADITPINTNTTNLSNSQIANSTVIRPVLPDAGSLGQQQFNTFNPPGGPVYFYHPLTPLDMSAFDALTVGDDAYQFIGGTINIVGHDGLLPRLIR